MATDLLELAGSMFFISEKVGVLNSSYSTHLLFINLIQELSIVQLKLPSSTFNPHCSSKVIELNGHGYSTVLLENPKGNVLVSESKAEDLGRQLFS